MENPASKLRVAWSAIFIGLAATWRYGFSVGSLNAGYFPIKSALKQYYEDRWNSTASDDFVDAVMVAGSAAFPVGGIFGSLLVGVIVRRLRILMALTLDHLFCTVISAAFYLVYLLRCPEILIICRFGIGVSSAAAIGLAIIYITRISPKHLRGVFGSMVSIGIALGITASNTLGLPQIFGRPGYWPILLILTGSMSVLFIFLVKTFIDPKQNESTNNQTQVNNLLEEGSKPQLKHLSSKQVLQEGKMRRPLASAVIICAGQQLSGLNGVSFNMNFLYNQAGVDPQLVPYVTIGVSASLIFFSTISAKVNDRFGRKPLLMSGFYVMGVSLIFLSICTVASHINAAFVYLAIISSGGFWIGFCMGPGPLAFVAVGEFFEESARAAAVTISTVVLWITFAIVVIAMPYLLKNIGGYGFLPFAFMSIAVACFIYYRVPETKNKTFEEIQRAFERNNGMRETNSRNVPILI